MSAKQDMDSKKSIWREEVFREREAWVCEISCIMQNRTMNKWIHFKKKKCTVLRPKNMCGANLLKINPPVFHSIYSTTSDLYKLHSTSIITNKNNKKYSLCIYLYSVGKEQYGLPCSHWIWPLLSPSFLTVSSSVLPCCPDRGRLQPHCFRPHESTSRNEEI